MNSCLDTLELDPSKLNVVELFPNVIVDRDDELHQTIGKDIAGVLQSDHPVLCTASEHTYIEPYAIACNELERAGGVAKGAMVFALDEYYPIRGSNPNSFRSNMDFAFLNRLRNLGLRDENIFFPNPYEYYIAKGMGDITKLNRDEQLSWIGDYCRWFEERIEEAGGFELALIGCGPNRTNGFNLVEYEKGDEPDPLGLLPHAGGVDPYSRTRIVPLSRLVMRGNNVLDSWEDMWPYGVTMGNGTLNDYAKGAIVLVTGDMKRRLAKEMTEGYHDPTKPHHVLRESMGNKTTLYVGRSSAGWLTRMSEPWRVSVRTPGTDEISGKDAVKIIDVLCREHGVTSETELTKEHLGKVGLSSVDPVEVKEKAYEYISSRIVRCLRDIPTCIEKVGTLSPHPDDVGYAFYHPQMAFAMSGVQVIQMVLLDGFDAVRLDDIERTVEKYSEELLGHPPGVGPLFPDGYGKNDLIAEFHRYREKRKGMDSYLPERGAPMDEPWLSVSKLVRFFEASEEVKRMNEKLGRDPKIELAWVSLPYYGECSHVMKPPYGERDISVMQNAMEEAGRPDVTAETVDDDPNLNHRKVQRLFLETAGRMNYRPTRIGYCGSWARMDLERAGMLFPVTKEAFEEQKYVMTAHESQGGDEQKFAGTISGSFIDRVYRNVGEYLNPLAVAGVDIPPDVIGYQAVRIISDEKELFAGFGN